MATKSISQLNARTQANISDLFEVAYADEQSSTGYGSGKMSAEVIANGIVNSYTYTSAMPNMGNRTIAGAMNTMLEGFAPAYDDTQTYAVGDYCTYAGKMYICSTAVSTAGAWDSTKWTETTCAEEFGTDVVVDSTLSTTSENPVQNKVITQNINSINANLISEKTTAKADIVSISDAQDIPAEDVKADIEPVQDLHGYEYPWVGGAGKNIVPLTINELKTGNTNGTWSGNTYVENGITFELLTDNADNITGIKVNGTALATFNFVTGSFYFVPNTTYYTSGCPSGGSNTTYECNVAGTGVDYGNGGSLTYTGQSPVLTTGRIKIYNGADISTPIIFYPMIRTSGDATFAPYSNICPISGYDSAEYTRTGINLMPTKDVSGIGVVIDVSVSLSAGTYTLSAIVTSSDTDDNKCLLYERTNNTMLGTIDRSTSRTSLTFTTANPINVISFYASTDYFKSLNDTFSFTDIQIEQGDQATTYQPYQGNTYTVQFKDDQDASMTVYSGTLDVTTGVLTVDKAMVDLGDLTWTYYQSLSQFYSSKISNAHESDDFDTTIVSDSYPIDNRAYSDYSTPHIRGLYGARVYIIDTRYDDDVQSLRTALTGSKLLYPLATPQVYSLTPTQIDMLLNNNVISASTGTIQVKYQPANVIGELKKEIKEVDDKIPATPFDGKKVLFIGDSFMEGFGARVADGLDSTTNPITTPELADSTPMRGWAKTFQERYPKSIVHNLSIYGATIAYQNNAPSVMGQLTYIATNSIGGEYVVLDGGANDVFQGITKGSAKADDVYEEMNWDTMNYNTYQTIPCLEAIFAIFAEHFPTVRILFVSPPPMDVTMTAEMETAVASMRTDIIALCEKWGVKHIDIIGKGSKNTIYSNNTDYYSASDKIHPLQRFYDETIGQIDEVLKQF